MRLALLVTAAALMFFSTLMVPNVAHADNGGGSCGTTICKPMVP
jgi:hypothetical protein